MSDRRTIRLLLLDDHAVFREALAVYLAAEPGFEVAARCASVGDALDAVLREPIDVVLLDLDLGDSRGGAFCTLAREAGFAGRILVLTARVGELEALQLWAGGVSGIFLKSSSPELLAPAIRRVAGGETWMDPAFFPAAPEQPAPPALAALSGRERLVLMRIYEGLGNKEIAAGLNTTEASIKSSIQRIFVKLGVRSRSQLVRAVARHVEARCSAPS